MIDSNNPKLLATIVAIGLSCMVFLSDLITSHGFFPAQLYLLSLFLVLTFNDSFLYKMSTISSMLILMSLPLHYGSIFFIFNKLITIFIIWTITMLHESRKHMVIKSLIKEHAKQKQNIPLPSPNVKTEFKKDSLYKDRNKDNHDKINDGILKLEEIIHQLKMIAGEDHG